MKYARIERLAAPRRVAEAEARALNKARNKAAREADNYGGAETDTALAAFDSVMDERTS